MDYRLYEASLHSEKTLLKIISIISTLIFFGAVLLAQAKGVHAPQMMASVKQRDLSVLKGDGAVLQGLDKVTARIFRLKAPDNTAVVFGSLVVTVRACYKRPPEETPETSVFLEIDEIRNGVEVSRIFSGWMFGSSPALSALEHPVYDVWVLDCMNAASAPSGRSFLNSPETLSAADNKWR